MVLMSLPERLKVQQQLSRETQLHAHWGENAIAHSFCN